MISNSITKTIMVRPFFFVLCQKFKANFLFPSKGKYDCQICGKSFKTDNKLRLHKYINHSGKMYYCDKCEYKTTNPSNVQSHRRIHNENRHFECDICKKKTTTRLRMKIHRRIHTGMYSRIF
jgi:hypothetical protein